MAIHAVAVAARWRHGPSALLKPQTPVTSVFSHSAAALPLGCALQPVRTDLTDARTKWGRSGAEIGEVAAERRGRGGCIQLDGHGADGPILIELANQICVTRVICHSLTLVTRCHSSLELSSHGWSRRLPPTTISPPNSPCNSPATLQLPTPSFSKISPQSYS